MATEIASGPAQHGAGIPNTAEGLLADRQVVWGNFTKVVLWSTIVVAATLVLLIWAVL